MAMLDLKELGGPGWLFGHEKYWDGWGLLRTMQVAEEKGLDPDSAGRGFRAAEENDRLYQDSQI